MQVIDYVEQEDGSALVTLDMTEEEKFLLIESAIIIGLIEGIKLVEKERIKECQDLAKSTSNT